MEDLDKYIQNFNIVNTTPEYAKRKSEDDRFCIMFCEILVWRVSVPDPDWWTVPKNRIRLTEVESVEISKTYKKLIQTATVTIPRGTVCELNMRKGEEVKTGEVKQKCEKVIGKATENFDLSVPSDPIYNDDTTVLPIFATRDESGIIKITRNEVTEDLVSKSDLQVGSRIDISLAYAYSEKEFNEFKSGLKKADKVFRGIIKKCSVDTPLVLQCEDMASVTAKVRCPDIVATDNMSVNAFLAPDGKYNLLKGTGLEFDIESKKANINVGKINLTTDNVLADMLDEWSKCGLFVYMNEKVEPPVLRVGRVYTTNFSYGKGANVMEDSGKANILQSDWDFASDNLKVNEIDRAWMAVRAVGLTKEGKYFDLTVRMNPEMDHTFQMVNYHEPKSRAAMKKKAKEKYDVDSGNQVSMKEYTIIPYTSAKMGITKDELRDEAIAYFKKYNCEGVSGSLTLFGDRDIKPTETVGLIDTRHPERNGWYFVESVDISFSVSGGYRKTIKIPYKLGKFPKQVKIIR